MTKGVIKKKKSDSDSIRTKPIVGKNIPTLFVYWEDNAAFPQCLMLFSHSFLLIP